MQGRNRQTCGHNDNDGEDAVANAPLRMGPTEWGLIVLQSMLWGSAYFFIAIARNDMPALSISTLRLAPAFVVLLTIVLSLGYRLPATWAEWRLFIFFSAFNNVIPFVLVVYGQKEATGGMAAIFNATAPLFGVFLAHLLTHDEKLSWNRLAGILMGIAGVAVLVGHNIAGGSMASLLAYLALLGAPFCYAMSNVFVRRRLSHYEPFILAVTQMAGALILSLALALVIDRPWTRPIPALEIIAAVVAMGVLASALASLCHFTVLQRAGATNALLVTLIMPLTPIVLGGLFLGDRLTPRDIAGALIIAAALIIIDGRIIRRLQRSEARR